MNFDEYMLNRQSFPYQNFALRNSRYGIFYGYNLLTWVCQDSVVMLCRDMEC